MVYDILSSWQSLSVVVKKNGLPRREIILSKFVVVISFEEWFVLEVGAGQSFP
jgi:hypothetical protein